MRKENFLFIAVLLAVVAGILAVHDDFFTQAQCEFAFLLRNSAFRGEGFLRCSNVDQEILGTSGVTDEPADVPGWSIYRPVRPDAPGSIRLRIRRDRDTAFFYPRVSGRDSAVTLAEPTVNIVREWVVVRGQNAVWTPISRRYIANLACLGHGDPAPGPAQEIEFILTGPWAQLWHQGDAVLF